ncbi:hypothetical protein J2W92_002343 [Rhizobium leguminosarum]
MDISLALDHLVPAAEYFGSLTANDQDAYDALEWIDARAKPSWSAIEAAGLAGDRSIKIAELTVACAAAMVSGYTSAALGDEHIYPSKVIDQINMMGSVTASLLPGQPQDWTTPFWCADETGAWAFRLHTAAQIQSAGADGKAHILHCQTKLSQLSAQVMAAASAEAVAAIVWEIL